MINVSSKSRITLIIACVAALLMLGVYVIAESQRAQAIEASKRDATQQLGVLRARLEGQLNANLVALRGLRAEIQLNPSINDRRFEALVRELMTDDLQIRHIALAPNLVVQSVYPLAGNENVIGFDYRSSPAQLATVQKSIEAQEVVLAGPVDLVQGGRALIARMPIVVGNERVWGLVSQVIDTDELLQASGFSASIEGFNLALRGGDGKGAEGALIAGNPEVWEHEFLSITINIPAGEWQLAVYPKVGTWHQEQDGYWWRWTLGTLIAISLLLLLTLLLVTQRRLRKAFTIITHQARFDPLTQLPNRSYFVQQLQAVIDTAKRHQQKFAVLFIDLDHFKEVNDSLGHEVGDQLLQHVAQRIRSSVRPEDIVARLGGDEFIVLLNNLDDSSQAELLAQRLVNDLQPTLRLQQSELSVSASIGIAMFPIDGLHASELLKHADLAMYAAKSAGRQTVYFFDHQLRYAAEQHIALHHDIKTGLERGDFLVYYQPVIDVNTNEVCKCEALLRWHHPTIGMIPPAEFIAIAEKTGAIVALGEFVLEQALQDWQLLAHHDCALPLSINRSPREFNDVNSADDWIERIEAAAIPTQQIMLEITESILMRNKERQLANLEQLRHAGIHIAIDDFGTGYSSLNYLRKYPVDFIKIDRSFLIDVPENPQQVALLASIIQVAKTLQLGTIAEGVETAEHVQILRQLGCDYMQGFYIARPMPLQDLTEWLSQRTIKKVEASR